MSPDDVYAKMLSKLLEAGGWPAFFSSLLAGAYFWFRGKNVHPEWAEKSDLTDLKAEVRDIDTKVDGLTNMVHDTRETMARIEGLLDGRKR